MPINKISIDFIRKHSDVKTTRLKGKTKAHAIYRKRPKM